MGLKKVRTPAFSTQKKVRVPAHSSNIRQIITLKNAGTLTFVTFFHPKNFKHPNFCPIFTPKQYKYAVCWWIFTPKSMENIIFIKQSPKNKKSGKFRNFSEENSHTPSHTFAFRGGHTFSPWHTSAAPRTHIRACSYQAFAPDRGIMLRTLAVGFWTVNLEL